MHAVRGGDFDDDDVCEAHKSGQIIAVVNYHTHTHTGARARAYRRAGSRGAPSAFTYRLLVGHATRPGTVPTLRDDYIDNVGYT